MKSLFSLSASWMSLMLCVTRWSRSDVIGHELFEARTPKASQKSIRCILPSGLAPRSGAYLRRSTRLSSTRLLSDPPLLSLLISAKWLKRILAPRVWLTLFSLALISFSATGASCYR